MSVLIKMDMPKSCYDNCPCQDSHWCIPLKRYTTEMIDTGKRFDDCPLGQSPEDVVFNMRPVVLCKDCKYCIVVDEYELWCNGFCSPARLVRADDYCSHGERRNV